MFPRANAGACPHARFQHRRPGVFRAWGNHGLIEGILTRYNKRTVTVITDDRRQWNVSPGFLRRVARSKTAEATPTNVIRLK